MGCRGFRRGLGVLFVQNALRLVFFSQTSLNKSQLVVVAAASGGINTHQCRCFEYLQPSVRKPVVFCVMSGDPHWPGLFWLEGSHERLEKHIFVTECILVLYRVNHNHFLFLMLWQKYINIYTKTSFSNYQLKKH